MTAFLRCPSFHRSPLRMARKDLRGTKFADESPKQWEPSVIIRKSVISLFRDVQWWHLHEVIGACHHLPRGRSHGFTVVLVGPSKDLNRKFQKAWTGVVFPNGFVSNRYDLAPPTGTSQLASVLPLSSFDSVTNADQGRSCRNRRGTL